MTRSKVSPDGRIADRDVAAKLVIIMVGLPARGKSYITKKVARYLSWQQHPTRVFNVGNRRRIAAGVTSPEQTPATIVANAPLAAASILLNGHRAPGPLDPPPLDLDQSSLPADEHSSGPKEQDATFFDPKNESASKLREQVAMDTLDELLDYLLLHNGTVGILDATNSTIYRRQLLVQRIKQREPKLGILFLESICQDRGVSTVSVPIADMSG